MADFWYLASPYTRYPGGQYAAFVLACVAASKLLVAGVKIYCPIAHSHPIAEYGNIDPLDHDLWMRVDAPFLEAARGIIVVAADGWKESRGIAHEITVMRDAGKDIVMWKIGEEIPACLLLEQGTAKIAI